MRLYNTINNTILPTYKNASLLLQNFTLDAIFPSDTGVSFDAGVFFLDGVSTSFGRSSGDSYIKRTQYYKLAT